MSLRKLFSKIGGTIYDRMSGIPKIIRTVHANWQNYSSMKSVAKQYEAEYRDVDMKRSGNDTELTETFNNYSGRQVPVIATVYSIKDIHKILTHCGLSETTSRDIVNSIPKKFDTFQASPSKALYNADTDGNKGHAYGYRLVIKRIEAPVKYHVIFVGAEIEFKLKFTPEIRKHVDYIKLQDSGWFSSSERVERVERTELVSIPVELSSEQINKLLLTQISQTSIDTIIPKVRHISNN
mmetsp:Transcript_61030/g.74812  ORF Transcript_61030/g.74812 Transcript_61030/m.74812 type:complete len:238 (-) Transcript_61030:61-774(-)